MQILNIDVTKIPKERIVTGQKGKYIDLVLHEKPDNFGNDGFVTVSVSKEERQRGVKGPIVGNWKHVGQKQPPTQQKTDPRSRRPSSPPPDNDMSESDVPF